jgi:FtsH-binding integral membrane protein
MKTVIKAALATLLVCGAVLLVLGIVIWTESGDHERLVAVHVLIGIVLVFALLVIAAIAWRTGVPAGTVAFAVGWGGLVVLLGLTQEDLVTGSLHWTIQVLHVAVSMGAIWWGRRLVKLIARARSGGEPTLAHPPIASSARN